MPKRCIMIFPDFEKLEIIHELRALYDPYANFVKPHITLVFPFDSDFTTEELMDHIRASLCDVKSFALTMQGISPHRSGGNYLFLNVLEGNQEIRSLHDKLYTGILQRFYRADIPYVPHMTIGKIEEENDYIRAIQNTRELQNMFRTQVTKISVETIGASEESRIEYEYSFID